MTDPETIFDVPDQQTALQDPPKDTGASPSSAHTTDEGEQDVSPASNPEESADSLINLRSSSQADVNASEEHVDEESNNTVTKAHDDNTNLSSGSFSDQFETSREPPIHDSVDENQVPASSEQEQADTTEQETTDVQQDQPASADADEAPEEDEVGSSQPKADASDSYAEVELEEESHKSNEGELEHSTSKEAEDPVEEIQDPEQQPNEHMNREIDGQDDTTELNPVGSGDENADDSMNPEAELEDEQILADTPPEEGAEVSGEEAEETEKPGTLEDETETDRDIQMVKAESESGLVTQTGSQNNDDMHDDNVHDKVTDYAEVPVSVEGTGNFEDTASQEETGGEEMDIAADEETQDGEQMATGEETTGPDALEETEVTRSPEETGESAEVETQMDAEVEGPQEAEAEGETPQEEVVEAEAEAEAPLDVEAEHEVEVPVDDSTGYPGETSGQDTVDEGPHGVGSMQDKEIHEDATTTATGEIESSVGVEEGVDTDRIEVRTTDRSVDDSIMSPKTPPVLSVNRQIGSGIASPATSMEELVEETYEYTGPEGTNAVDEEETTVTETQVSSVPAVDDEGNVTLMTTTTTTTTSVKTIITTAEQSADGTTPTASAQSGPVLRRRVVKRKKIRPPSVFENRPAPATADVSALKPALPVQQTKTVFESIPRTADVHASARYPAVEKDGQPGIYCSVARKPTADAGAAIPTQHSHGGPSVFEKAPAETTADISSRSQLKPQHSRTVFESVAAPSRADASSTTRVTPVSPRKDVFIAPAGPSTADTSSLTPALTPRSQRAVFESQARKSCADASASSSPGAQLAAPKRTEFVSRPSLSTASVRHDETTVSMSERSVFVSNPVESSAFAKNSAPLLSERANESSVFTNAPQRPSVPAPESPKAKGGEFMNTPTPRTGNNFEKKQSHTIFESVPQRNSVAAKWNEPVQKPSTGTIFTSVPKAIHVDASANRDVSDSEYTTESEYEDLPEGENLEAAATDDI